AQTTPSTHNPQTTSPDTPPSNSAPTTTPTTTPEHPKPAPTTPQTPTRSTPDRPDAGNTPTANRTSASPVTGSHRSPTPAAASPDWIDLAEGGALAGGVLAALTLALSRARRRRRWHGTCYWPTPGQHQTEPLTVPVPLRPAPRQQPTTAKQDDQIELDEFGAPTGSQQDPTPTAPEDSASGAVSAMSAPMRSADMPGPDDEDAQPARISVAVADGKVLDLQDLPAFVALTGTGAIDAARAIAAAVLSAAEHRRDGARLLISRQDAALLLETAGPGLPEHLTTMTDLEVFDDGPSAVTQLEAYTAYRTRLLDQHEATALEQILDEDDFPPIVLLAVARPDSAARVASTLEAGAGLRVHAILLGEHPNAANWHVDADGHLTGPDAPEGATSFRLSASALTAALTLLIAAAGDAPTEQGPPTAPD
ncbi:hypothetical protein KDK95_34675, partial [Actinospica sp. MGRD01-02]|nr:hypothetical protein [Actinospica acidithermotolerans]